jgi:hypothetical protein
MKLFCTQCRNVFQGHLKDKRGKSGYIYRKDPCPACGCTNIKRVSEVRNAETAISFRNIINPHGNYGFHMDGSGGKVMAHHPHD